MKKVFSKILISVLSVGIFMLPISGQIRLENYYLTLELNPNIARADTIFYYEAHGEIFGTTIKKFASMEACTEAIKNEDEEVVQPCTPSDENAKIQKLGRDGGVQWGCNWDPLSWFTNCPLFLLYYLIFVPLSLIAGVAADILDYFVYYSISDEAYRNTFVEKGWGTVRDVANIFFIIALLYIAIKTILNLNTTNNRKLLVSVIVFALIINFSLFATRVIVDTSNILAKIFYNQITPIDKNGVVIEGQQTQRSVTVSLVKKFDPIDIVRGPNPTVDIDEQKAQFLMVTLLSIVLIGFMIYIFLSVAMIFVARVVSIWLSMILSPLAFASHTISTRIPGMGWDEWWPNFLKNAFLAPIFIFFLYLIILFGDLFELGAVAVNGSEEVWIDAVMNTLIPFMLIFVLLTKAKKLAVSYAGEMGSAVTKGAAVVGGIALGGAALTTAAVGRGTVGAFMKGASTGDTAGQRFRDGTSKNVFDQAYGWATDKTGLDNWQRNKVGNWLNSDQMKVEHAQEARHELDKVSGEKYHGKKYKDLTKPERDDVKLSIGRDHEAQQRFGKNYRSLDHIQKAWVNTEITNKRIAGIKNKGEETEKDAKEKQGIGSSLMQGMRTGSYDVRNLSKVTPNEGDKASLKAISGLTSSLAGAFRGTLKKSVGFNYGDSQKSFFKDLGHTITEALKGASFKVDLSSVGKVEKEKHGGGDHH